ncbi:MAG TPA: hypothetical protein VLC96_08325, partial [Flavobacterium sp.]|nr:hypothetical protein [Flavobacterium sp.]
SLTGNYAYKSKALAETNAYTTAKNIKTGTTFSHLEIFTIGNNESVSPSKWLTEIYFPIKPKEGITTPVAPTATAIATPTQTTSTQTTSTQKTPTQSTTPKTTSNPTPKKVTKEDTKFTPSTVKPEEKSEF